MPALQKITTTYSEHEDRLRLAGQPEAGGASVVLWLTQRLANRLVRVLTQWLDKETQGQTPGGRTAFASDLRNAWAQEAAARQLAPAPPVAVAPDSPPQLVVSVDLSREGERYRVVFRGAATDEDPPSVRFSNTELRQWLGIVHGLYVAADWPLAAWPEWIDEAARSGRQPAVLH
jgi:hypothetical protein